MDKIYLDYNASTPISQEVLNAMKPYLEGFVGNPSSSHWAGLPFKEALNHARSQVAASLGCSPDEVVFTSGGSEANNHAIKGTFFANMHIGKHIITSAIEHPATANPCEYLKKFGAEITYLPVDVFGCVGPSDLKRAIKSDTVLITIMHANNEVGSIQPVKDLSRIAREYNILFHTDAAQSFGKIPVNVNDLGVDLLSLAGHKFHAPKGVGVLYIKKGTKIDSFIHGAGHENGRRAGTENILLDIGLGAACLNASSMLSQMSTSVKELRNYFWNKLQAVYGDQIRLNGKLEKSLPNTLSVAFVDRSGNEILSRIPQIAASTGSACHSGLETMSSVLKAMSVPENVGLGTIRFSLGIATTKNEIDCVIKMIKDLI